MNVYKKKDDHYRRKMAALGTWLLSGATRCWSVNVLDRVAVAVVVDHTLPVRLESFERFEKVQNLSRVLE
jgi:hypothetical protein